MKSARGGVLRGHEDAVGAFQRIVDSLIIVGAHVVACRLYGEVWRTSLTSATAIALVLFSFVAEFRGLYKPWRAELLSKEVGSAVLAWTLVAPLLVFTAFATKTSASFSRVISISWFLSTLGGIAIVRVLIRLVLRQLRGMGHNTRTYAVVGATEAAERVIEAFNERPWMGYRLTGVYDDRSADRHHQFTKVSVPSVTGGVSALLNAAREGKIDAIYIALPLRAEARVGEILRELADTTVTVHLIADFFIFDLLHGRWGQVGSLPVVSIYDSPFSGNNGWIKRVEDVVLGSMILVLIAIPMLVVAAAIKLTSPGPVFFRQRRYGLNGKEIRVLKFRSMTVTEDGAKVVQATAGDKRVTPIGRFIRKTSIDELPQFLQVITGEMSIVGPRPHAVSHNEQYRSLIHGYMLRHKVKPGITGWAQVNGFRGETDKIEKMENRVRHDLDYIHNWHLLLDLKIIFLTVFGSKTRSNAQ
jgi:putative colanic acid biosysnthesis UDP-glucose lipid carrier transferase